MLEFKEIAPMLLFYNYVSLLTLDVTVAPRYHLVVIVESWL